MNHQEWLEWRRAGVGSTDACVIMGVSPWRTPRQIWEEKFIGKSEQLENSSMSRGKELEPVARHWFEETMNVSVFPQNKMHATSPWARASLDGLDLEEKVLVEIKCPNKSDHQYALDKKVPEKYWPQVQHQLLVTGLPGMYYCSFDGKDGAIVEVARDDAYINTMFSKEKEFWDSVLSGTPPELTERDFACMSDNPEWEKLAHQWQSLSSQLKAIEEQEKVIRQAIIELSDDRNCAGSCVKLTKSICAGTIDYKQVMADYPAINWETYRKKPVTKWTFRATG